VGYTEAGASAKAVRIESSAAATATTAQTAAIPRPPCSSEAKKVDTGWSPASKRNCVESRRNGPNEIVVLETKNALSVSETLSGVIYVKSRFGMRQTSDKCAHH